MGRLSILGAFTVLQNNILGPGVLGLPWAVAQGGLGLGMVLLVLSAFTGFMGMYFLASAAARVAEKLPAGEKLTMATACQLYDARELRLTMEVGLVLACTGALVTSLIIIGDCLAPLGGASKEQWILGVFSMLAFPLSWFSQISLLRFSSSLSFLMMLYLAGFVVIHASPESCPAVGPVSGSMFRWDNSLKIFQTIPIFTFCFCGHMSIFSIADELKDVSRGRLNIVLCSATASAAFIFGTVAYGTVACFGPATPQDLLRSYHQGVPVTVARIGMAIVCCGFFPLLVQPVRTTCLGWFKSALVVGRERSGSGASEVLVEYSEEAVNKGYDKAIRHTLKIAYPVITVLLGALCLGTALLTSSLGLVFSLSGATGFALLCNICPPWLYLVVADGGESRWMRCAAWGLLLFGMLMMPVCITANFMAAYKHPAPEAAHQCQLVPVACDPVAFCHDVMSL